MILISTLTADDTARRVIYRAEGNTGAPEYAEIIRWTNRRIIIRVQGDITLTEALPIEVSWIGGQ